MFPFSALLILGRVHDLLTNLKNRVYAQGLTKMQREPHAYVFQ